VLHPTQIDVVNRAFSPSQDDYERAELVLDAYRYYTSVEHRGAVMLGGEMIDEASRKLALVTAAKGRAAGLRRAQRFEAPVPERSAEHTPSGEGIGQPGGQA
jgi:citrate lyase subunit beta/citryl-CoA lyase